MEEKEHLRTAIGDLVKTKSFFQIPWTIMLTSSPVLSLMIVQMGHEWGFYILAYEIPNYLKVVVGLNNKELAVYMSIAFFASYSVSLVCGVVCDYVVNKKWVTLTRARKVFTTIG